MIPKMGVSKIILAPVSIAAISGLAMTGLVQAADLPSMKSSPAFVPPPPVFTWTGLYAGGQIGYQWGQASIDAVHNIKGTVTAEPGYSSEGVVGGAHIGYNWQTPYSLAVSLPIVIGIEGDVDGSSYNGSGFNASGTVTRSTQENIEGSIRGRLGLAWDRALVYATGGAAFASIRNVSTNVIVPGVDVFNNTRVGWTVGGGVEYAIDNNWSIRAEYRYTDYGRFNEYLANSEGRENITASRRETDNAVRAGFSYKFDTLAPPPVLAKY